jgi:hypothetical protein
VTVAVLLQALGWVCVVWLVTVHLMIQRGRLPRAGRAYRVAGCAAAVSVVLASAVEEIWPVAVLGLLWLRIEVFGHRHAEQEDQGGSPARTRMPTFLSGALARGGKPSQPHPHSSADPGPPQHPDSSGTSHPHHLPHPHLGPRAVDRVFKFEMGVIIVIALVLFVIWGQQQREAVGRDANYTVCNWIHGC